MTNTTTPSTLVIIPARGGSKGIPRKNVLPLLGKPLIVWTIEAARQAQLVTRVVVSTDDEEIAEVARGAGAEVLMRPAELAEDNTATEPVLVHVLDTLRETEGYQPDIVVLAQCTSPLRGAEVMDAGIGRLLETGCDCVLTVAPVMHWHLRGEIGPEGEWRAEYAFLERGFSQQHARKFSENGALYVLRREVLEIFGNRLGGDVRALVMDWAHSVDIDRAEDLELAELLMKALGQ
jgi:N-acylneuraminate cytidylyltransferase